MKVSCECGCGGAAPIARMNDTSRGYVKGEPHRFIQGHGGRKPLGEGVHTKINGKQKRVARVIAEKALGKPLPDYAAVHHVNGDPVDQRNENLVVCEGHSYHWLLHKRMRAYEACGYAHYLKCAFCKEWDDPVNLYVKGSSAQHRTCFNNYRREWRGKMKRQIVCVLLALLVLPALVFAADCKEGSGPDIKALKKLKQVYQIGDQITVSVQDNKTQAHIVKVVPWWDSATCTWRINYEAEVVNIFRFSEDDPSVKLARPGGGK